MNKPKLSANITTIHSPTVGKSKANDPKVFTINKKADIVIPLNTETSPDHMSLVPHNAPEFINDDVLEQLAIAINKNIPVLMIGETGVGKTSAIRYLAHKTNNAFRRVNHNGGTAVDDIIGKILVSTDRGGTYWIDGVLVEAMRKGYWYLADELNASNAEINFAYHSLLDDDGYIVIAENGGEIVRPHHNFRFFAGINPSLEYAGTKELNRALMSRFLVINIEYPDPKTESKILSERTGISDDTAQRLVKYTGEIRAMFGKGVGTFSVSTRDLLMWATMYQVYGKYMPSGEIAVLNKAPRDERTAIKDIMATHFSTLDKPPKAEKPKINAKGFTPKTQKDATS